MQRITLGMVVWDVRGRRLGTVAGMLGDCYEVAAVEGGDRWLLTQASIFNVTPAKGVELVCDLAEVGRYACPSHPESPPV